MVAETDTKQCFLQASVPQLPQSASSDTGSVLDMPQFASDTPFHCVGVICCGSSCGPPWAGSSCGLVWEGSSAATVCDGNSCLYISVPCCLIAMPLLSVGACSSGRLFTPVDRFLRFIQTQAPIAARASKPTGILTPSLTLAPVLSPEDVSCGGTAPFVALLSPGEDATP